MPILIVGPRRMKLWTTYTLERQWATNCPHVLSSLEHAIRFSQVISTKREQDREVLLLGYRTELLLFIAKRKIGYPSWGVCDVYSPIYYPSKFGQLSASDKKVYRRFRFYREKSLFELPGKQALERTTQAEVYRSRLTKKTNILLKIWPIQKMHATVERERALHGNRWLHEFSDESFRPTENRVEEVGDADRDKVFRDQGSDDRYCGDGDQDRPGACAGCLVA